MVTIEGNGSIKIVSISKYLSANIKRPYTIISYNFIEGVTNEEKGILLSYDPNLFSIRMITLPDQAMFEPHIQFHHELRMVVVDETLAVDKVKTLKIIEWTLS